MQEDMQKSTEGTVDTNNGTEHTAGVKLQSLPENVCEEKIFYYRDLFRLDFRVYNEKDDIDDTSYCESGRFFNLDDEDVVWYQKKFESLNALDVFYNLCLDYCQAVLKVLKKNIKKYPLETEMSAKKFAESKNRKNKSPDEKQQEHHMHKLLKEQIEKTITNQNAQIDIKEQISIIKKKIAELGLLSVKPKRSQLIINQMTKTDLKNNLDTCDKNNKLTTGTIAAMVVSETEIAR